MFDLSPTITELRVGHYVLSKNPYLKYELKKNARAYFEEKSAPKGGFWDGRNWGDFSTNPYVFVDRERSLKKPDETIRIAVTT